MENNKSIMARANLDIQNLTAEQQLVVPFYDTYVAMYPNVDKTTAFRVAMNFAYELAKTKNKAGFPAIQVCTPQSIRVAFDEVIKYGLDLSLQQAVLIIYQDTLKIQMEYFGWQKILKDFYPNSEIVANVVYEGEPFVMDRLPNGRFNFKHTPNVMARKKGVISGAYFECRIKTLRSKTTKITYPDGRIEENAYSYYDYEVIGTDYMTFDEIKKSWAKSKNGPTVHNEHPHEMAKKTVINRGCKALIKTADSFNSMVIVDSEDYVIQEEQFTYTIPADMSSENFQQEKEKILEQIKQRENEQANLEPDTTNIYSGEPTITDDGMVYYEGCQVDGEVYLEPQQEVQEQEQSIVDDGWFELPYRDYKDNKDLYEVDKEYNENGFARGYNSTTKNIRVRRK